MGRKGDINTRAIATRIPTQVFVELTLLAVERQQTMSALLCDILSTYTEKPTINKAPKSAYEGGKISYSEWRPKDKF